MTDQLPRLAIARAVGLGTEHHTCGGYIAQLSVQVAQSGEFAGVEWPSTTQSRILDSRNTLVKMARDRGCEWLLFIDPDMQPDIEVGKVPTALPFFPSSYQMLKTLKEGKVDGCDKGTLGIIAAPALSGPPDFKVNVLVPSEEKEDEFRRVTPKEAMERNATIERVLAIGTGLMLIPMEVFDKLEEPYFDDIYKDKSKRGVWSSQDTTFCLKCNEAGVTVWCNWYSWARHWKWCPVDRPDENLLAYLARGLKRDKEEPCSCQPASQTSVLQTRATSPEPEKSSVTPVLSSSPTTGETAGGFPFRSTALSK